MDVRGLCACVHRNNGEGREVSEKKNDTVSDGEGMRRGGGNIHSSLPHPTSEGRVSASASDHSSPFAKDTRTHRAAI